MSHRTRFVKEQDVVMLDMLTDGLRKEMNYEIRMRHLSGHPLFDFIDSSTSATIHRLTSDMVTIQVDGDDSLCLVEELSECMYITLHGQFTYLHDGSQEEFCVQ